MRYEDMYEKPIDRPIDAVVKASSVEHLANELDESPSRLGSIHFTVAPMPLRCWYSRAVAVTPSTS